MKVKTFVNILRRDYILPNFKIIQDQPEKAKVQIFGTNTTVALNTDSSGNLAITTAGGVALPVTFGAITGAVTFGAVTFGPITGAVTFGAVTFGPITGDVTFGAVTFGPITGDVTFGAVTFGPITGDVTFGAVTFGPITGDVTFGAVTFGPITGDVTFGAVTFGPITGVVTFGDVTFGAITFGAVSTLLYFTETSFPNITVGAGSTLAVTGQDISILNTSTWLTQNSTATDVTFLLQGSPNNSLWVNDGIATTVNSTTGPLLVTSNFFLKYSRLFFNNPTATTVSLNVWFNGQG